MYISNIKIENFRHLEQEELGPFKLNPNSSELIALAGPNGSGKSSILELIGYALSNSYSLNWSLNRSFSGFSFEIGISLIPEEKILLIDLLSEKIKLEEQSLEENLREIDTKGNIPVNQITSKKSNLQSDFERRVKHHNDVINYLNTSSVYYRSYNYADGEYQKQPMLHNQIHSHVTTRLKDELGRSLGFFLKSDRNYPQTSFDRNKIFTFEGTRKREHLWSMAYNTSEIQYKDMYEFLVQQRYHYLRELGEFHDNSCKGRTTGQKPEDPLIPYENLLKKLFPDYSFSYKNEQFPTNLFIELPTGDVIPFNDLSSGEKEVFFILSFFVRHDVKNAIISIDEPELHLHPELSRILLKNMLKIRSGNQVWVATHNAEIIDEAGSDKVIYCSRDKTTRKAKFTLGLDEHGTIKELKNLFGYSGFIGVAKNLVFLEGDNSSQDRKVLSNLFPQIGSEIKLVPSSTCANLQRINTAIMSIMDANIGYMNFFLLRDRDYLTEEMAIKYSEHASRRIFVLSKHEIENYLIEFDIIEKVLKDIFEIDKDEASIREDFKRTAIEISSSVLRDMVAYRLNLLLMPQDFSIGKVLENNPYFSLDDENLNIIQANRSILHERFLSTSDLINSNLTKDLSKDSIKEVITRCETEIAEALDSDEWLNLFPGKELLAKTVKKYKIDKPIFFQNSVIKEFSIQSDKVDKELINIFDSIKTQQLSN